MSHDSKNIYWTPAFINQIKAYAASAAVPRWLYPKPLKLSDSHLHWAVLISYGASKTWPSVQVIKHLRATAQTFLWLSGNSQLHSLWQEVKRDTFIDTDLCNNYTASCMHYWSEVLIKSYFTVKVCWFDALQHKSPLTSHWFGSPAVGWWMHLQINTSGRVRTGSVSVFITVVPMGSSRREVKDWWRRKPYPYYYKWMITYC